MCTAFLQDPLLYAPLFFLYIPLDDLLYGIHLTDILKKKKRLIMCCGAERDISDNIAREVRRENLKCSVSHYSRSIIGKSFVCSTSAQTASDYRFECMSL